jgi:hypothetical protein
MHSTSNLEDGYIGSGKRLWNSINKHGRENHSIEILEWFPDRSSLKEREKELVNESLLQDPMCMNLAIGGGGGFINRESAAAGSRGMNSKTWSDPEFVKRKKQQMSEISKRLHKEGKFRYDGFTGKTHSEETKRKIGKANSEKQSGAGNSQYGTCWITNGTKHKKIKKTDELPSGWSYGRK